MKNEYKTLEQQIIELWDSFGMKVIREQYHLDTWIITIDQKNKNTDYNTIEKKIKELWKSRGMEVRTIKFKLLKGQYQWTIIADRKSEEKKCLNH